MKTAFKAVFLSAMLAFFASGLSAYAQNMKVTGKVVDEAGDPVIGVVVFVQDTKVSPALTDIDGHYSIVAPPDAGLTFSCLGYKEVEVKLTGNPVVNVTLIPDTVNLDEAVVIGYGSQKRCQALLPVDHARNGFFRKPDGPNLGPGGRSDHHHRR